MVFSPVPPDKINLVKRLVMRDEIEREDLLSSKISIEKDIHISEIPLRTKGRADLFVLITARGWCGTIGCSLVVYQQIGRQWVTILDIPIQSDGIRSDLFVDDATDFGFHRLVERSVMHYGNQHGGYDRVEAPPIHFIWDGTAYQNDDRRE